MSEAKTDADFLNFINKQKEEKLAQIEPTNLDTEVLGMLKDEAIAKIKEANHKVRVVAEDGEHRFVTMDSWPDRLNLEIVDGKVVKVSRG